jgi:hypothetical protein
MEDLRYVSDCLQIMKSKPEYIHLYNELVPQLEELNQKVWYRDAKTTRALQMDLCKKAISEMCRIYTMKKWNQ